MLASVALGVLAGVVGFTPLLFVWRAVRGGAAPFRRHATAIGLLGVGLSFILLLAALFACFQIMPGSLLEFALALVVTFLVGCLSIAIMEIRS